MIARRLMVAVQAIVDGTMPSNTILYLPFDGTEGSTSYPDLSGSGQTQTVVGGTSPTITATGATINECVDFVSTTGHIRSTAAITQSIWGIGLYVTIPVLDSVNKGILTIGSGLISGLTIYFRGTSNTIWAYVEGLAITNFINVAAGTPIHIELNCDGAYTHVYVDGVKQPASKQHGDGLLGLVKVGISGGITTVNDCKIDNLIVTDGSMIHSTNFTPPTANYT